MTTFDPSAYFQKQFDILRKQAADVQQPALRAAIKPKLLTLLSQYRLKLPLAVHQERVVEAGGVLASLGEYEAALRQCFSPILATANTDGLAAPGLNALRLRVQADFGSVGCSFELLMARDARIEHAESTDTVRDLLRRVREGLGACVKHESLYWLVLNGTRLAYQLCTTLMRPERAADAIETLAWCSLCMEGMLPLLAPRFCEWRVQLYTALCHCCTPAAPRRPPPAVNPTPRSPQPTAHIPLLACVRRRSGRHDRGRRQGGRARSQPPRVDEDARQARPGAADDRHRCAVRKGGTAAGRAAVQVHDVLRDGDAGGT